MGDFASSDQENDRSGCATGGWHAQLTFDWMLQKDFGVALQYTYQRNLIEDGFNSVFPNGIPDSAGSGAWSNNYLLVGPVFMKTIGRLYIDAKLLGGLLISTGTMFDIPDPSDTTGMSSTTNVAAGFAYQVSAGVGFAVSSHFIIKFNLSIQGGWPAVSKEYGSRFIGYEEYINPKTGLPYYEAIYSAPITYEIKKVVTTFNPAIGLVYRF
jgi:hypothetical protein